MNGTGPKDRFFAKAKRLSRFVSDCHNGDIRRRLPGVAAVFEQPVQPDRALEVRPELREDQSKPACGCDKPSGNAAHDLLPAVATRLETNPHPFSLLPLRGGRFCAQW